MPVIVTLRAASVRLSPSEIRNFPAAWRGEVSEEIATALEADGAATVFRPAPVAAAAKSGKKAKKAAKPAEPAATLPLTPPAPEPSAPPAVEPHDDGDADPESAPEAPGDEDTPA